MEYNGLAWAWLENVGNNLFGSMACWFQFLGWATLTWGFINVCGCIKVKWFGFCTFRSGPFIELGLDWDKAFGKLGWDSTWSGLKWTRSILQWIGLTHPTNKSATYSYIFLLISLSLSKSATYSGHIIKEGFKIPISSFSNHQIASTSTLKVRQQLSFLCHYPQYKATNKSIPFFS